MLPVRQMLRWYAPRLRTTAQLALCSRLTIEVATPPTTQQQSGTAHLAAGDWHFAAGLPPRPTNLPVYLPSWDSWLVGWQSKGFGCASCHTHYVRMDSLRARCRSLLRSYTRFTSALRRASSCLSDMNTPYPQSLARLSGYRPG